MTKPSLKAFDLVIFDWAGTMVDFGCCAPVQALIAAFARRGVEISDAEARVDMGQAKADHVRGILGREPMATRWTSSVGRAPNEDEVTSLMADLGPLMTEAAQAASALIPGALGTYQALRAAGLKVASSTGYTRDMMQPVLAAAAAQGYAPDHLVCANETVLGRPAPMMIYKACAELGVWPLSRVIKVDDAEAGVAEGRNAGCFTIGLAASGNGVGLSKPDFDALDPAEQSKKIAASRSALLAAGADLVIDSVADLMAAFET
jgi:phosphonoacetaldehyde hydrolase